MSGPKKGVFTVKRIRIGASDHLANRPLLFGLSDAARDGVELVTEEPGALALSLERGELDAALIPSIEFLRGVGECTVPGPALVARGGARGLLLVAKNPIAQVQRIAVDEFSRTPLVALRAVLDKAFSILPDLWVVKRKPLNTSNWREEFDAALLTDDEALQYAEREKDTSETCHDIGEMWCSIFAQPLVVSVWAYNDPRLGKELEPVLVSSRDRGMHNLAALCETISRTSSYSPGFLLQYYSSAWGFHLGPAEEEALRLLEDVAYEYQLLQQRRLENAAVA
ncbi:MAG: mqnA [Candidatus Krumholzibacteriota bacterium]|nr:mqnA [Candidatus Krumholzibacteriota bacterium]